MFFSSFWLLWDREEMDAWAGFGMWAECVR